MGVQLRCQRLDVRIAEPVADADGGDTDTVQRHCLGGSVGGSSGKQNVRSIASPSVATDRGNGQQTVVRPAIHRLIICFPLMMMIMRRAGVRPVETSASKT